MGGEAWDGKWVGAREGRGEGGGGREGEGSGRLEPPL